MLVQWSRLAIIMLLLCVLLARRNAFPSTEASLQLEEDKRLRLCTPKQPRKYSTSMVYNFNGPERTHVDLLRLARDQAAGGWTEDTPTPLSESVATQRTTYSVIVVHVRPHCSNLFRDQQRVRAFASHGGRNIVEAVQFASPFPPTAYDDAGQPPFLVEHARGADKRIRLVHVTDFIGEGYVLDSRQVSHLKAACEDASETTILVMVDETCGRPEPPFGTPSACLSNIVRIYPFNDAGRKMEYQEAYVPLGPRDTFPFVVEERRRLASERTLLFNLQVTTGTSKRRSQVVNITKTFSAANPDVPCWSQDKKTNNKQWQELLLDSKFTLCPGGHNAETFRMWEALEAGAIPIVSKLDYTNPAYSKTTSCGKRSDCGSGIVGWNVVAASPFAKEVSVGDWTELPVLLTRLLGERNEYLNSLQARCYKWYSAVMEQAYASMLHFGQGSELFAQRGPIVDNLV